jgi:histidine triad (HIT) family protein
VTSPVETSTSCDFCAIVRGEDSSVEIVCRGEDWIAFFPLNPATRGHTLIIPRTHVADLWKAKPSLGAELMNAVIRVGRAIDTALQPEGMNLITSAGQIAEQTIFHLHLHIVPRSPRDGFGDIWPPASGYEDTDLGDVAERIRGACADAE